MQGAVSGCRVSQAFTGVMQVPLQPLQDNLELQTYETFERDTPKYTAYEEAVHDALLDRVPQSEAATTTTVLMVRSQHPIVSILATVTSSSGPAPRPKVVSLTIDPVSHRLAVNTFQTFAYFIERCYGPCCAGVLLLPLMSVAHFTHARQYWCMCPNICP